MEIRIKSAPVSFEARTETRVYSGTISTKNQQVEKVVAVVSAPLQSINPEGNPVTVLDHLGTIIYDNGDISAPTSLAGDVVEFLQLIDQLNGNDS